MTTIGLDQAKTIIAAVLEEGGIMSLQPLSVAVLDPGGHLIAFERSDGASIMRPQIAIGKAASALSLGISSRKVAEMAAERPSFVAALGAVAPAGMIPAAGGIIITDGTGNVLGAVGVTGDTSDNDEVCALAGIEAAGLKARV